MTKRLIYENTAYSLLLYCLFDRDWKTRDYLIYGDRVSDSLISKLSQYANRVEGNPRHSRML